MSIGVGLGRVAAGLFRLTVLAGLVAGVPYGLVTQIGWPLPHTFPASPEQVLPQVQQWLTTPVTDQVVLNLLATAMWILWGSFTASVLVELPARVRGVVPRRMPVLAPMQNLAGWLLSGITIGALATGTLTAPAPSAADPAPAVTLVVPEADAVDGVMPGAIASSGIDTASYTTAAVNRSDRHTEQLVHEVAPGDWMWYIAGRYLGDEQRYPEIATLNPELAARYPDYPDHIQPGDLLVLPADAQDRGERTHATGDAKATPAAEPEPESDATPPSAAPEPEQPPALPASPTPAPDEVSEPPAPDPGAATSQPPGETAQPGTDPAEEPGSPPPAAPPGAGVDLPSGAWISLGLAALIASVGVVLRLHQRRRRRLVFPIPTGTQPAASPVPDSLRRADAAGVQTLEFETTDTLLPGLVPVPPRPPAAVGVDARGEPLSVFTLPGQPIAFTGDGALSAARGVLAAAVSTGISEHPDARPMVVTDAATLGALLPPGTPPVGLDPDGVSFDGEHLLVTGDTAEAVHHAEAETLARWRLLDQFDVETVDALNARDDHAERQPPYLLLLHDVGRYTARLQAIAACRDSLNLHVLLLDPPPELPCVRVDAHGGFTLDPALRPDAEAGGRLSTLSAQDLAELLDMVRQAAPRSDPDTDHTAADPEPAPATSIPAPGGDRPPPVQLRVLGPVSLHTEAGPVSSGIRSGSYMVLASLAAHPEGRGLDELAASLHPDAALAAARARVRTDINHARAGLRKATGIAEGWFIVYDEPQQRYRIDADLIEVDLWRMLAAIETANRASDDDPACLAALREAAAHYAGEFAASIERAWVVDYAVTFRSKAVAVHARIAEILEADQPDEAITALEHAVAVDPLNEDVHQRLMRIHGRLGNPDRVRVTLRQLEERLAEAGYSEPTEATRRVAQRQLAGSRQRPAHGQASGQQAPAPATAGRPVRPATPNLGGGTSAVRNHAGPPADGSRPRPSALVELPGGEQGGGSAGARVVARHSDDDLA